MPRRTFSTATTPDVGDAPLGERPLVTGALALYALVWGWAAVRPLDRAEWWMEQLLPAGWLLFLALAWRKRLVRLSDASCAATALFLALHAVGARYGYEGAPAGRRLAEALGAGRNPYDRVVHAAFGLCLGYVARELWLGFGRFTRFARAWASAHAWAGVLAASALYEVLEWAAALLVAPGLGSAFVGAQGDVWDAPADMAMAAAGAAAGLVLAELAHRARTALRRPARVYQGTGPETRHAARVGSMLKAQHPRQRTAV